MPDRTEVYQDTRGEWRWRRKASNGRTIADSGEGYDSKWNAQRAAGRVFGEVSEDIPESEDVPVPEVVPEGDAEAVQLLATPEQETSEPTRWPSAPADPGSDY